MQGPDRRSGKKASNGWKKQRDKIATIHRKIADTREDYINQVTAELSRDHAVVVIEDLKIRNMSASAAGSIEAPGKNVRAKSGLNRSILDGGFYQFRSKLEYKVDRHLGTLICVDPKNTSRQCRVCGYTAKENRKTQEIFKCVECGHTENADIHAAKNILERAKIEESVKTKKTGSG